MKRKVELQESGNFKITEETGEIHYTQPDRPINDGFALFQGVVWPILTQSQVDTTDLPHYFNVDDYSEYPAENSTLFPYLVQSQSLQGRSICERIARVKIAHNLTMFETENN